MPLERLPDTFGAGSELKMTGGHYVVVGAEPATKAKAAEIRHLEVIVRER